jgi:hypothetical protein
MNKKGITLIELIVFIIVGAIFIPLAYIAFTSAVNNSMKPETAATTRVIAEGKIADITKDTYDNIPVPATYTHTSNSLYTLCSAGNSPDINYYCEVPNMAGFRWKWRIDYVAYTSTGGLTRIETPPNWTANKNPPYNIGDYVKPSGFPASPYNHFYRVYFPQWENNSADYHVDDFVRITDGTYYRRLPPDIWSSSPSTPYVVGVYVSSPSNSAYFYRLTSNSCAASSSLISGPVWPLLPVQGTTESELRFDTWFCSLTWTEDTTGYNNLSSMTNPTGCIGTNPCTFPDNLRWQRTNPSLVSGNAGSFDFASYIANGIEFNDNGVRWKESTVYKQINVYILPPGCSVGQTCEYMFTTITTAKNYTPVTGRP